MVFENIVEEEFDDDGEVTKVGDYTFVKMDPLGSGSFAKVRLAHRPSRIEAPLRLSVTLKGVKDVLEKTSSEGPEYMSNLCNQDEDDLMLVKETKMQQFWIDKFSKFQSNRLNGNETFGTDDDCKELNDYVAIKIFNKDLLNKRKSFTRDSKTRRMKRLSALDLVHYEIALMKKIRHPNLLRLHEVLDSDQSNHLYIILDYCALGEIMTFNEKKKQYSRSPVARIPTLCQVCGVRYGRRRRICVNECQCFDEYHSAGYMVDILCGLAYLHRYFDNRNIVSSIFKSFFNIRIYFYLYRHHICHRDLKPENIL